MLKKLLKKDEGFTLIEITIVLAIVGLIFVIIFLAVTTAQRGQADTARKDNVNRTIATIQQQLGNNGSASPTTCAVTCTSLTVGSGSVQIQSPVTSVTNTNASISTTAMLWNTAATGCAVLTQPTNGGTTGLVAITLAAGGTYCRDY